MTKSRDKAPKSNDPLHLAAEKALYLLGLGELDHAESMAADALARTPDHAFCNYATAVVVLARARSRTAEANHFSLMAQEAELRHEEYWQDLAGQAVADILSFRQRALTCLLRAYHHWPQHTEGTYTYFIDHVQRRQAIEIAADLAFKLAHEHGSVDLGAYGKILARQRGEPVDWFFAADLDPILLALLHEHEKHGPGPRSWNRSRFELATTLLQLYFVLSPTDYARYLPIWKDSFAHALIRDIEPYLLEMGYPNPTAKIVREHLRRATTETEREAILVSLKQRHQLDTDKFYSEVATFMSSDGTQQYDGDDDFADDY